MALDDLKETIATLQARIRAHHAYLTGYETRTRQALIDPLLRALGWDVEDPDSVKLEYGIKRKWADYALMKSEKPIAVIEAKALGKALQYDEKMQALNYANMEGIDYMAVTNGDHWQLFDVFARGPLDERILMKFQLAQDEPYACALQALALWRPNLASGKLKEAATPVTIKSAPEESTPAPSSPQQTATVRVNTTNLASGNLAAAIPESSSPQQTSGEWQALTELQVTRGQRAPTFVQFPNSSPKPLGSWVDLWVRVAEYLVETGKISERNCPIKTERSKSKYLLHTEPKHANGREFMSKRKVDNLWLDTFVGSTSTWRKSRWLLKKFSVDPATVFVSTTNLASGNLAAAIPVTIKSAPEESTPAPISPQQSSDGWQALTEFHVEKGQRAPASIQFPNSTPKPLSSWVDLWASVAEYLVETDKISERDCPIKMERPKSYYLLHTEPKHPNGKPFYTKRKIGNLLWSDGYFNNSNYPEAATERSRWLLEKFGVDPATVRVNTNQS